MMKYLVILLVFSVIMFLYCSCIVSGSCEKWETNMKKHKNLKMKN